MNMDAPTPGKAEKPRQHRPGADDSRRDQRRQHGQHPRVRDARNNGGQHRRFSGRNKKQGGNRQNQPGYGVKVGEPVEVTGILDIQKDRKNNNGYYGFIRVAENNWAQEEKAIYIRDSIIEEYHLRPFSKVKGLMQRFEDGARHIVSVLEVNGLPPEQAAETPHFDDLKAVNPSERISFETVPTRYTTRTLDLVAPVARGQRGLIVAPPRTGKTTLLLHIAEAVLEKYKGELELLVLLVDERPEEVTEFRRALPGAEIFASSNDSGIKEHCRMAEMCITYAKRLLESGKHVLVLMDSITRLARAYNNAERGSGRTMSGGIDARALETPRMLFAAARNTRQAGSITILATALIETNSRMDELIFQEFKGTGNMELVLNRRIAELYIYPAVDILKSGTRREELILPPWMLEKIHLIRRALAGHKPPEAMERLLFFMKRCPGNAQMLMNLKTR